MLLVCCAVSAQADVALSFKLSNKDAESGTRTISISQFFARIDDPAKPGEYLIYQAGKFFPLYAVDNESQSYRRLSPEVEVTLHAGQDKPQSDIEKKSALRHTELKPTRKQQRVAGILCRVVEELENDQVKMSHCMADKSRLGLTEREVRTLSRVFKMAREQGFGWLGTATKDEKFVSIQSRDPSRDMTLELVSVSTQPLVQGYLRIPKTYRQTLADKGSN
jgi:hypothetical protein